jgi:hypothetical protein
MQLTKVPSSTLAPRAAEEGGKPHWLGGWCGTIRSPGWATEWQMEWQGRPLRLQFRMSPSEPSSVSAAPLGPPRRHIAAEVVVECLNTFPIWSQICLPISSTLDARKGWGSVWLQ